MKGFRLVKTILKSFRLSNQRRRLAKELNVEPGLVVLNPDGQTYDVYGHVRINFSKIHKISFPIGNVYGDFSAAFSHLQSCFNFPNRVFGNYDIRGTEISSACGGPTFVLGSAIFSSTKIKSFEGFPETCSMIDISSTSIFSLSCLHRYVKEFISHDLLVEKTDNGEWLYSEMYDQEQLSGVIVLSPTVSENILSPFMIDNFKGFITVNQSHNSYSVRNEINSRIQVFLTANKYILTASNPKDIIWELQEELISTGQENYAKI